MQPEKQVAVKDVTLLKSKMAGLEEHVTCSICMDLYNDPLALPCLHSFCRHCVQGLFSSSLTLTCPECRKEIYTESRGIDNLPRNFQLAGIVESYKKENDDVLRQRAGMSSSQQQCEQHTLPGELMCKTCQTALCFNCLTSETHPRKHKLQIIKTTHKTPQNNDVISGDVICGEHEMQFRCYCTECEAVVCLECIVRTHGSHSLASIDDTYEYNLVSEFQKLNCCSHTTNLL